jgi:hypothetical protein
MEGGTMANEPAKIADEIRRALIERALAAFDDASLQGLCCEGAWEAAMSALRDLDISEVLEQPRGPNTSSAET